MFKGYGEGADLRTCLILSFLLLSHDMVPIAMRSKDERTKNAALLRYTCGHDGRYFGLFRLIVMDVHIRGSFFMFVESDCISTNIEFTVP